jgi:hypothetical protein
MKMLVLGKKIIRLFLFGSISFCIQMISISACTESSDTSAQTKIENNLQNQQDLEMGDPSEKDNLSTLTDESDSFCIDALLPTEDHHPMIKIGTGRTSYQSIDQMQTLTVVKGPQGGYHIWGSFMAKCIPFQNVRILFELKDGDRLLAMADYTEMELSLDDHNAFEYLAVTVIYLENDWVMENTDKVLTFSVKLSPIDQPDLVFSDQIEIKTACCQ